MSKVTAIIFVFILYSCGTGGRIGLRDLDPSPFEKDSNHSASYQEISEFYKSLDKQSNYVQVNDFGMTDAGHPLQEVIIDYDKKFTPESSRELNKAVVFINNGIHAGEPCGIDASMKLVKKILSDDEKFRLLERVTIVIVPVYNIGGAKNRNSFSRANQNGPEEHGFRGNAKNLDLNRDFIKADSKNSQSFAQLFTKWSPEVFIDTHTSNGADYQHIITLIATQKDKLAAPLSGFMENTFLPQVYDGMTEAGYVMSPYIYSRGKTPDEKGIMAFPDLPRYSSGYAALHQCLGFMPETHMLKTYKERVESTEALLTNMISVTYQNKDRILQRKRESIERYNTMLQAPLAWEINEDFVSTTYLLGYESEQKESAITGQDRLYYNRDKPYEKEIPYYDTYKSSVSASIPKAYIIPQAYSKVIERLEWNGVKLTQLEEDKMIQVESYYIKNYKSTNFPYESHYLHYETEVEQVQNSIQYFKGDYIIEMNQDANRFIFETLEPLGPDSYFSWNFFDGILMQKEHFSSYVFEELALEILEENPTIKYDLEAKKKEDEGFAKSSYQQLDFIYKRSKHYEKTHNRYPIGRVLK